jgi:hypothetical protein
MISRRLSPSGVAAIFAASFGAVLGVLSWSGQAFAYCRAVTLSPPDGYDPATQGCFGEEPDGGLYPLYWRNQCVGYSFQPTPSKYVTLDQATQVAAQAFTTWANAPCENGVPSIFASQLPAVECNVVPPQGHNNVIMFRDDVWPYDDAANAIGFTTLTVRLSTGEILGADVEINTAEYTIVTSAPPAESTATTYDLASILTHEAGHFLGLAHSADTTAVMYAYYKPGSTSLSPDDVAGICSIYSSDGSRNTSEGMLASLNCDPSPVLGFELECGSLDAGTVDFITVGSGPTGAGFGDGGETCTAPSCSTSRGTASGPGGLAICGAVALGALARRTRRRGRTSAVAAGVFVGLASAIVTCAGSARASTSVALLFEDLVRGASAVAIVTPMQERAVWEEGRIVTYTEVHIERLVAGRLPGDVWVRTLGGAVGDTAQLVEGGAKFVAGKASLVFVRPHVVPGALPGALPGTLPGALPGALAGGSQADTYVVIERAQGQFPIVPGDDGRPRLAVAPDVGLLLPPGGERSPRAARPPSAVAPRFARDVLVGRTLEEAVHDVAAAWTRLHDR